MAEVTVKDRVRKPTTQVQLVD